MLADVWHLPSNFALGGFSSPHCTCLVIPACASGFYGHGHFFQGHDHNIRPTGGARHGRSAYDCAKPSSQAATAGGSRFPCLLKTPTLCPSIPPFHIAEHSPVRVPPFHRIR